MRNRTLAEFFDLSRNDDGTYKVIASVNPDRIAMIVYDNIPAGELLAFGAKITQTVNEHRALERRTMVDSHHADDE